MSRNAVGVVSAIIFVALAIALVVVPVPYVVWRPGQTIDVLGNTDSAPSSMSPVFPPTTPRDDC